MILLGYFIRRTVRDVEAVRGKTFSAMSRTIYPTREAAAEALIAAECGGYLDTRFNHDVAECWMKTEEER